MKKFFLILFILILPVAVFAQVSKKKAVYFYNDTCSHCYQVDQYFQKEGIYEKYDIQKIETSSAENLKYLNDFFDAFGVKPEKRGWPVIFFGNNMLIGDRPIINNFIKEIESNGDVSSFPTPQKVSESLESQNRGNEIDEGVVKEESNSVSMPILISAALVDAINPCAFAVLILLVATVIASKGKTNGLVSGLLFSLAIFLSYFMMGLGIYKAVGAFNLPKILSIVIGVLAILIGLANLKDFLWYGKFFVMEVPFSWRPKMQAILKRVTSPIGAMGAGFLVSLFLLPCTSGPYVVVLGLMAQGKDLARTISLLLIYNLIFVLPMIGITMAMYFGVKAKKLDEFRKSNIKLLHAIAGIIMLFIGVYLIYNWI